MQRQDVQDQVDWLRNMEVDKFALCIFNHLAYNCEISGLLAANTFLGFLEYYTSEKSLKKVNLKNLWLYFPKIIFHDVEDKEAADSLILFGTSTMMPTLFLTIIIIERRNLNHILFIII